MTISLTPCPNSEFLLKLHDGERTVMTLTLTADMVFNLATLAMGCSVKGMTWRVKYPTKPAEEPND